MSDVADTTITAAAPFDNPDGDIILHSANGVNFHVFKLILSLMSPVFKDMFTLPQNSSQLGVSSVPVIPVTESSTILEFLLSLCYPAATPTFDSFDNAKAVMEAAKKYNMQAVLSCAADLAMSQFLPTHFLDLYALSCRFAWQHHAQAAATRSLEIKNLGCPSTEFESMRDITALDHHRLLVYHHACGAAACAVGNSLSFPARANYFNERYANVVFLKGMFLQMYPDAPSCKLWKHEDHLLVQCISGVEWGRVA